MCIVWGGGEGGGDESIGKIRRLKLWRGLFLSTQTGTLTNAICLLYSVPTREGWSTIGGSIVNLHAAMNTCGPHLLSYDTSHDM